MVMFSFLFLYMYTVPMHTIKFWIMCNAVGQYFGAEKVKT
jgi:hypothetical protein